jgi:hypothetical protein
MHKYVFTRYAQFSSGFDDVGMHCVHVRDRIEASETAYCRREWPLLCSETSPGDCTYDAGSSGALLNYF